MKTCITYKTELVKYTFKQMYIMMNFIEKIEFSKFTNMKNTIPCGHLAWIYNFHSDTIKKRKIIF